ncbi:hypothetical protein [Rhodanobacter sp. DHG33]|uniref:hypothetical protein n=1 Tax=Rhodanobacter sp. DHG33 TaxID=2775921 RepID=UPI001786BAF2|nr:hypothetical protein [Rhodanobacter sp. DHG33]MBD8898968.1 hypothetical protein [Rhodanobacter sp. DHG33]
MNPSRLLPFIAAASALLASGYAAGDEHPNWKSATYISAWGPCPPGENCGSEWLADRATHSIVRKEGSKAMAPYKLSDQEWIQLEAMINAARQQASTCPPPPNDVFETLEVVGSDGTKLSLDVTGCAFDGNANAVKTLAAWFQNH